MSLSLAWAASNRSDDSLALAAQPLCQTLRSGGVRASRSSQSLSLSSSQFEAEEHTQARVEWNVSPLQLSCTEVWYMTNNVLRWFKAVHMK